MSFRSLPGTLLCTLVGLLAVAGASVATARTAARSRTAAPAPPAQDDFHSAIVIDAATGHVLYEDKPDVQNPPASVTKLMTFAVVADALKGGRLTLQTPVEVSAAASHIGGSRVYLKQGETFAVDDLLYALMVQSANDAAYALAEKVAGSRDAFVDLMNAKARALGMTHSVFHSPHGLPPGRGQSPDLSTARDIATLCYYLLHHTDILRYTSTRIRDFRPGPHHIMMVNHNHLLRQEPGCDGFKTGWYERAGYSLAATVQRDGRRIIAVILGCPQRKLRDAITRRLIDRGFAALPPAPAAAPAPAVSPAPPGSAPTEAPKTDTQTPELKLVPLTPADKKADAEGGDALPSVHLDLAEPKK